VQKLKVGYLVKRRDACWAIRVQVPATNLILHGHEYREELLELQAYCRRCRKGGPDEFQFKEPNPFKCPTCGVSFELPTDEWRQKIIDIINWSDVVVFQRPTDASHLYLMKLAKKSGKKIIFEGDDDYLNVEKWNPGYEYYRVRKPIVEEMLRICDGITVTTECLREVYLPYNPNVRVLKNCIDIELLDVEPILHAGHIVIVGKKGQRVPFSEYEEARKKYKIIGWGGSPTHEMDLALIVSAVKRIARKEPVAFAFAGYVHRAILEFVPDNRIFCFFLVPMEMYFSLYKTIKFDIGLAPVAPVKFNESKSANKLIEYHAMGILPVVSDFVTYKNDIHRGFLASPNEEHGWVSAMRHALNCTDREERLLANRKYAEDNYDIKTKVFDWIDFYQKVLEGKK
jgi:glycosyltransferase involved in cell wall biosynthesis